MATFGQIVSGHALNVVSGADVESALAQHFVGGYDGGHPGVSWTQIPDGTRSGAKDNGDGTFTNPASSPGVPAILGKTQFRSYAVSQLGGGVTGMARVQAIMDATEAATGAVKFCFTQYQDATSCVLADMTTFLAIVLGASIITQDEHDAVLNNWPTI